MESSTPAGNRNRTRPNYGPRVERRYLNGLAIMTVVPLRRLHSVEKIKHPTALTAQSRMTYTLHTFRTTARRYTIVINTRPRIATHDRTPRPNMEPTMRGSSRTGELWP